MTKIDTDLGDDFEDRLKDTELQMVADAEQQLVADHDGSVIHLPSALVSSIDSILYHDLRDLSGLQDGPTGITYLDAQKLVAKRTIETSVGDYWSSYYDPEDYEA